MVEYFVVHTRVHWYIHTMEGTQMVGALDPVG